ncbi:hypothetical protein BRADI_3g32850v3 [Brachypodium distachyon]|uniref:PRONE domain-containing protein n=1 Tax=Brachypodium distachyon TaxID=15368 RepID=A0A0Q3FI01_BRADI|nr:hypothetical protein BRADI_3g32850v3 [Brachypodium distachyon]
MADSSISSPSLSASDESSELDAGCYSSSTTTAPPSLPDTADFSRSASDASSFSDHSGPFGAAAVSKLIAGRGSPAGAGASLRRLSMKPRADVLDRRSATAADVDELELVKERFSKLLLGEDMSGGGKGVCAAVAISNAITNLYATVFGSCCHRLEPLPEGKKAMWRREMDCLLSVCDHIVEFYPSSQALPDGTRVEVMATRPRSDIYINLPALEKLDAMLIIMDGFEKAEFWYADDGGARSFGSTATTTTSSSASPSPASSFRRSSAALHRKNEDKWWVPVPCVPDGGLSAAARKELRRRRDCASQIHKAAVAINSDVLGDMEVPESFMALLPKSGKASVGDAVYRAMMGGGGGKFSPDHLLDCVDVSSEHEALALADRVEAAMYVWRRKASASLAHGGRWVQWSKVKELAADDGGDGGKNMTLASRAESLLLCIKHRFPGLSQTTLDTSKIQFNKDVGQAILESYSRVLESLAFSIVSWIDDVLFADKSVRKQ